ncbi:MAG: aldo/keto reductase [Treponema sp.]|nr:aldo/keto reductase [Treponema sp.]MCQ2601630.1 aldo/keto reductase [Treponema sp.]
MEIKKLGFGLMRLPFAENPEWGNVNLETTKKMIDKYMDNGFSYFDTAWVYHGGNSEKVFGELVAKRYPREKYQVVSKMPLWDMKDPAELQTTFDKQLSNCGISYFDYYFLHALNKANVKTAEKLGAFEWMQKMKQEGKILHPGFSFHDTADVLDDILNSHPEVELVQLQINYIDWESDTVQSRKCYEVCKKHGVLVSVMEPVKGGSLANVQGEVKKIFTDYNPDASVASWAIRYCASLDNILVVLSGMSNMEQLDDNISYMKDFKPLNEDELNCINQATEILKANIAVPCTACRYCTDGCPMKINIPRYFELLNDAKRYGKQNYLWNYNDEKKKGGSPDQCIGCGACQGHCPQKIEIIEFLKKVVDTFEK